MTTCSNCGSEYEGKFCPYCGTSNPNAQAAPAPAPQRYAPPPVYNTTNLFTQNNVTSTGGWIGWMFLISLLPVIGSIIMLCSTNDQSAKNFAKAQLILTLIGVVITILLILFAGILGASLGSLE